MLEKCCFQCTYFHQHYILDSQRCATVNCGHCTRPRIKHRKPDTPACEHFQECKGSDLPDRSLVIDFLTTTFLKEILKKSLPPEIKDDDRFDETEEATNLKAGGFDDVSNG